MSKATRISVAGGVLVMALALAASTGFGQTTYITNTYQNGINGYGSVNDAWGSGYETDGSMNAWNGGAASMGASHFAIPHPVGAYSAFVAFEDLGIPSNAVIMNATLSLRVIDDVTGVTDGDDENGTVTLGASGLLLKFDEGSVTGNMTATNVVEGVTNVVPWNLHAAQNVAPGYFFDGVYDRGPEESVVVIGTSDINTWFSWEVSRAFRAQFEAGKEDYGFVVSSYSPNGSLHDGNVNFRTWEYNYAEDFGAFGEFGPKLEVIYTTDPTMNLIVERSEDGGTTWVESYSTKVPVADDTQDFRAISID